MLAFALVLAVLLALGPPAVHSRFNTIAFSSVTQCGSFNVHFSGGKMPAQLPLTLTVVPFDSTPISIVIPSFTWNATTASGAVVTFLPLPAGAQFVASLDDAYGRPTGLVSDVIAVDPSSDTSCLPDPASRPVSQYQLPDLSTLSQCNSFDISYPPGTVDVPPTIRAFVPRNHSFPLNLTSVPAAGRATYTLNVPQGRRAIMMLSDDRGFHQSTDLFVVGGNSSSSTACLPVFKTKPDPSLDNMAAMASPGGLSKAAVIAIAVVISVVVAGIALAMVFWTCRHRRKLRASAERLKWVSADPELWGGAIKTDGGPYTGRALSEKDRSILPIQNPPLAVLRERYSDHESYVVADRNSKSSSVSSSSLRSLKLLQPGGLSGPPPATTLPSLHTSPFVPGISLPSSRAISQRTVSDKASTARTRTPTSVSSEDIEYMLEMGTVFETSPIAASASMRSIGATNPAASDSRSNIESGAFTVDSLPPPPPPSQPRDTERPLPRLPSPISPNPSYVRTSDGIVVTDIYDASNWVARSMPPSPDPASLLSAGLQPPGLLTPMSYRSPPHALVPSSPTSQISAAAADSPYVVAGSRQP
ncbi:hypothetical protein BXZ70DRAFT_559048 [Cristinia sonorae]|uniref:Uncharacterized protein n=1 Tax=Cristinia sonorae TaxID=1940300 RepID=A0A8K0UGL5_9AGAR|nr:hypothetical protein BXZ70DRAFT_559048 [Cristinia sonorae]